MTTLEEAKRLADNVRAGTYISISISKQFKDSEILKAWKGHTLIKSTEGMIVRLGIETSATKPYRDTNTTAGALSFGKWLEKYEGFILEYNETYYLRFYSTLREGAQGHTVYKLDGEEITKEELIKKGVISEKKPNAMGVFLVKLDNLTINSKKK
jgi:hypothetical protein